MLVLSQASVGLVSLATLQPSLDPQSRSRMVWLSLLLGLCGLGASIFHLGRPSGAWRAFLNFRRSWMSREIVLFGIYLPMLAAALFSRALNLNTEFMLAATALLGVLSVFCSVMIYHDTQRSLWHRRRSAPLFFGTLAILGSAAALVVKSALLPIVVLNSALAIKFFVELLIIRPQRDPSLKKTALIIASHFQHPAFLRLACGILGGLGLPLFAATQTVPLHDGIIGLFAFALLLAGEILERLLFFRAVDAPKMPGGLPA
jgi:DMSO reductase anchor subunit